MKIFSMEIIKGSWGNYDLICSDGRSFNGLGKSELLEKINEILDEERD